MTVIIKGTQLGAATDMEGRYSLTFLEGKENPVLVFTMVGMETVEVKYQGKDTINVVMKDAVNELEDVVVTGIFTRKKESFTGSVSSYTKNELKKVEEEITTLESRGEELDEQIQQPEIASNVGKLMEIHKEKEAVDARLADLYERWEQLAEDM